MFRIITDFVEKPTFLVLCDQPHCGVFLTAEVPPASGGQTSPAQEFCGAAMREGWQIGLDMQICPQHMQQARDQQRMIHVVPSLVTKN